MAVQDGAVHETSEQFITPLAGDQRTLFLNENAARPADNPNARVLFKHPDGTLEPIVSGGAGATGATGATGAADQRVGLQALQVQQVLRDHKEFKVTQVLQEILAQQV